MKSVMIKEQAGEFCENKDVSRAIRIKTILPALVDKKKVTLDFAGVDMVTQSFIHSLIAEPIREFPEEFFELVSFKNCNKDVRTIVEIVAQYMQDFAV